MSRRPIKRLLPDELSPPWSSTWTTALVLAAAACLAPQTASAGPPAAGLGGSLRPVVPEAPAREEKARSLGRITFAATGDMMNHVSVQQSANAANRKGEAGESENHGGFDALFEGVREDFSAADFTFVNLETPIAPKASKGVREFVFNSPPELVLALKGIGVNLVSFANNHVYDQGRKGFVESLGELEKAGMPYVGAGPTRPSARKGLRLAKNGVRVAVLAASEFFNSDEQNVDDEQAPHCNKTDDRLAMEEAVKAARADADFVVVSAHWGKEYKSRPRASETDLAHRLFEAGADVVLGHHPHVLQPLELYSSADGRTCLCAYSLGNFISNQSRQYAPGVSPEEVGDTRDGVLLRFAVEKRDYGSGVVRAELADVSFLPLWTENDFLVRKPGAPPVIRVVAVGRELLRAQAELDALQAGLQGRPSRAQADALVRLKKRIAHLEQRKRIVATRLGSDFLSDPRPSAPIATPAPATAAKP